MPGGNLSALAGSSSGLSGGTINTSGFLVLADRDAHRKMLELSLWIVDKIQASVGSQTQLQRNEDSERLIQERFTTFVRQSTTNLDQDGTKLLYQMVLDELFGFGPLEQLIRDDTITEIMVNSATVVYVEQKGKLTLSPVIFASEDHVLMVRGSMPSSRLVQSMVRR